MAKMQLSGKIGWFDDLADSFGLIVSEFPVLIEDAAKAQMEVVEKQVKRNWAQMIPHGKIGDYVYESVGSNVVRGNDGKTVLASVGVFKIDSISSSFNKVKSDINAPQLAWWTEFGTYGNAGIPFLFNAFYVTLNEQEDTFKAHFEADVERLMK